MREFLVRRFLLGALYARQQEFLRRYPQMCCYSFDVISLFISVDGRYEREELELIRSRFRDYIAGRTVLDIGANIGNHTLVFAETAARVIALEPHPLTFRLLELNSRDRANVTLLNLGASDRHTVVQAFAPRGNMGGCSIGRHPDGEPVQIKVQPLDDLPGLHDVGLVKIDVEGHEEQAIRGMQKLLSAHLPLVVFEQKAELITDGTSTPVELLRTIGYSHFYSIERRTPWRFGFGRAGHVAEALLLGMPPPEAFLAPIDRLKPRDYSCLVAAPVALQHAG